MNSAKALLLTALSAWALAPATAVAIPEEEPAAARAAEADATLVETVRQILNSDPALAVWPVELAARDGIVSMVGTVSDRLAKDRVVEKALLVPGIRGVVDRSEITDLQHGDAEIRQTVRAALADDGAVQPHLFDIRVQNGIVTLTGNVETDADRRLAVEITGGARGVRQVIDALTVERPEFRPAEDIAADVQSILDHHPRLGERRIEAAVADGTVLLSGAVESEDERALAQRLARVAGVRSVDADALAVRPTGDTDFRPGTAAVDIVRAVRDALALDPRVHVESPDAISVSEKDGTVVLKGAVIGKAAKMAAGDDAGNVAGVSDVVNDLSVVEPDDLGDETLAALAAAALERDPYLDDTNLRVSAQDGAIELSGTVQTMFQSRIAERVIQSVPGIAEVTDDTDLTGL